MPYEEQEAHLAAEWSQWNQKKRPATLILREELLRQALKQRAEYYGGCFSRIDGGPLTPEDRRNIRMIQRASYRKARAYALAGDAALERSFWSLMLKFGLGPEGGVQ